MNWALVRRKTRKLRFSALTAWERVRRKLPGGKKSGIFDAMTKANPGAAAEILVQLVNEQEHDPQGAGTSVMP